MTLFIDPHSDDVPLFCAFPLYEHRHDCHVIVVFDSYIQPARGIPNCSALARLKEAVVAYAEFGIHHIDFLGFRDDTSPTPPEIAVELIQYCATADSIYCPLYEDNGHHHHNAVHDAAVSIFKGPIHFYTTYTRTSGRTRTAAPYPVPHPPALAAKHRALAHFQSQMQPETGCLPWFLGDLNEYIVP